jgi:hypothetical protein
LHGELGVEKLLAVLDQPAEGSGEFLAVLQMDRDGDLAPELWS